MTRQYGIRGGSSSGTSRHLKGAKAQLRFTCLRVRPLYLIRPRAASRGTLSYASDLALRLRERDFTVFFSEDEAAPGEQLDSTLINALYRSRTLVVIANRSTLQEPRWVEEVEASKSRHPDRPIIPISVGGALQDATLAEQTRRWLAFDDKIWLDESHDGVAQGIASNEMVTRLAMAPAGRSSNVKWRWAVGAIVAALLVLAVAATGFGIYARNESRIAVTKAKEAQDNGNEANRQKAAAVKSEGEARKQQGFAEKMPKRRESRSALPKGKRLATASEDYTTKVWDAENGKKLLTLRGHSGWVSGVIFSPDGKRLATAGWDSTVQVYALDLRELLNLARRRVTRPFTAEECQRYFPSETCPPLPAARLLATPAVNIKTGWCGTRKRPRY